MIRHILDKGFHQIRYFGFYSNKTSRIKDKHKLLKDYHIRDLKNKLSWRIMLLETYKYDPMLCACGGTLSINYEMSLLPIRERNDNYG